MCTLQHYELITLPFRGSSHRALRLAVVNTHLLVTSCTIAWWLKKVSEDAGVDVSCYFSAHSICGALSSAAALAGVTTNDIFEAANCSMESVFRRVISHVILPCMVMQSFQLIINSKLFLNFDFPHSNIIPCLP